MLAQNYGHKKDHRELRDKLDGKISLKKIIINFIIKKYEY
jgi:hypothetical protein